MSLAGGIFFDQILSKQIEAWQVVPRPERFTELYFTDARSLPSTHKSNATQDVTFTVHNVEHQTVKYNYRILAKSAENNTEQILSNGGFTLTPDQTRVTKRTIRIPPMYGRTEFKVSLEYTATKGDTADKQTLSIHYWTVIAGSLSKNAEQYEVT